MGYLLFGIAVTPFTVSLQAWALTKLWEWFLTPAFGLPAISLVTAIGICAAVAVVRGIRIIGKEMSWEVVINLTLNEVVFMLTWLLIGFVAFQFAGGAPA